LTDRGDGISAICISPDKRFLAVAEKSNVKMPFLVVYDMFSMRKRRGLSPGTTECRAKEFTHISFSSDSKFCVAILGEPHSVLHYYLWESGKIFAIKNIFEETKDKVKNGVVEHPKILQADLNPKDSTLMCVLGETFVKMYKYTSGELDLVALDWGYASCEVREKLNFLITFFKPISNMMTKTEHHL
jgi:6-phosphogluconolactonase (cycloisomerase 2 family)